MKKIDGMSKAKSLDVSSRLFEASSKGDVAAITQEIKYGANASARDERDAGYTCIHKAARGGHTDAIRSVVWCGVVWCGVKLGAVIHLAFQNS